MRSNSLAILLAACASSTSLLHADVIDTTWLGGNGSWHNPAQWSGGVVPNNSGSNTFRATLPLGLATLTTPSVTIDELRLAAPVQLRLMPVANLTVNGNSHIDGVVFLRGGMIIPAAPSLSGTGTIVIGETGVGGALVSTGAMEIPAGLHIDFPGVNNFVSRLGSATASFVNRGYIIGGQDLFDFRPIILGSTFSNLGTIEVRSNSALSFGGTFTRADLGNLVWNSGGRFGIGFGGTLNNENQTLEIDAAHQWELTGGTIKGGTINIAPGTSLVTPIPPGGNYYYGALDDVIVNGEIYHGGFGTLDIRNGTLAGNARIVVGAPLDWAPPRLATSSATLTISSTVTVTVPNNSLSVKNDYGAAGIGNSASAVVNHGTILAGGTFGTTAQLGIYATSFLNDGTLALTARARMFVAMNPTAPCDLVFGPGGTLRVDALSPFSGFGVGTLQVTGALDLSTPGDALMLSGFDFDAGTFYRIVITGTGVIGQFDSITPGYEVEYRNGTEIWARFVPEPAGAALLCCGASIHALSRRRRRKSA